MTILTVYLGANLIFLIFIGYLWFKECKKDCPRKREPRVKYTYIDSKTTITEKHYEKPY